MKLTTLLVILSGTSVPALGTVLTRQGSDDTPGLYLCSNPDFDNDCQGCVCESLTDVVMVHGYGGPACFTLPDDLRAGNPQGVSSARAFSGWRCILYDNESCDDSGPNSTFSVPSGPPGAASLGPFDDRAMAYRCYVDE
ncbi:hypothetical protein GGR54DRAFT_457360 [Hypoxylon sp. NC1633]|nr:hypothetical protein GGR54DRAFT_457360 [Hypoxylon sp. NC1633]